MPRDGSGNYTLPIGNPVVTDTVIEADWANDTMSDVAVQFNNVLTRDGVLGPLQPFKVTDGSAAAPGLAFNSEPGNGWYRPSTSQLAIAMATKVIEFNDAVSAVSSFKYLYPRTAGNSGIRFNTDVYGTANTTGFQLLQNATEGRVESVGIGTGVAKPIIYSAEYHKFLQIIQVKPASGAAQLALDKPASGQALDLIGRTSGNNRWRISLGNTASETGSNVGSDFIIDRWADNGSQIGNVLFFQRNTGDALFSGHVTLASGKSVILQGSGIYLWAGTGNALLPNSYTTSGSTRIQSIVDTNSANSGFGVTHNIQFLHNPGVDARVRIISQNQLFDMTGGGQGQSSAGWVATSDIRVKDKLQVIGGALNKLFDLSGYTFDKLDEVTYQGHPPRKAGYIAQEVQKVLPEAVTVGNDEMGTLFVDHNALIGLIIQAMKEMYREFAHDN